MAILGRVTLKIDGKILKTKRGSSLTKGGLKKTAVVGSTEVHGFSAETTAPMMNVKITQTSDWGLTEIQGIDGATGVWEGDDGINYTLDGITCVGEPSLTEVEGEISAQFSAISCTKC